jgi:hypothetical protein
MSEARRMKYQMRDWESFLYESKPYAYVALGVYALSVDKPKPFVVACAILLLFAGILVLRVRFRNRPGSNLESLFYESLPFIYIGLGVYALVFLEASKMAVSCGVVLLFCATKVIRWRMNDRS